MKRENLGHCHGIARAVRLAPFRFALSTGVPYAKSLVPGDIVIASAAR
jgi:hypothetical protein